VNGNHRGEGIYDMIGCTKDRYEAPDLPELIQREPEPFKVLFLNNGDEGVIFRRGKAGGLGMYDAYSELYEEYYLDLVKFGYGFLVYEGARHFKPENWGDLTEEQREDASDNIEGGYQFRNYDEVMIGTWRRATAADLLEVDAIAAEPNSQG
jgi:hypothetical protein